MTNNMTFSDYDQAFKSLNINPNELTINIIENKESVSKISYNNKNIYVMGIGKTNSLGYPNSHQSWKNQKPILDKLANDGYIRVFIENQKDIKYLGVYCYKNYVKKIAKNGFIYYEFNLIKSYHQF
jgi:hypothetical protein